MSLHFLQSLQVISVHLNLSRTLNRSFTKLDNVSEKSGVSFKKIPSTSNLLHTNCQVKDHIIYIFTKLLGRFWWSVRFMSPQLMVAALDFQYYSSIVSCLLSSFFFSSSYAFLKGIILFTFIFFLQAKCLIHHLKPN